MSSYKHNVPILTQRHRRHGHLFQNRYKSIVCQEELYLKESVRYIHLNLLRAGLVKDIKELNLCPWSGHSVLMGQVERKWQACDYFYHILEMAVMAEITICNMSACEKHNISLTEPWSGSRRHEIVDARRIVSWIAVRELGYSGADVARYLGVTTSCVNRSVSSGKRPKLEAYIK